ncbi:MAG: O-phosphoseryl-tRNA(Sec) selenium transferase [Candidatus Thorarchaeota archaeon]|nr:MAG: O-phosphoseryl-tRNA(Sec) selenium transferase [Candidatus Thorarchaeota archaeon]
MDDEIKKKLSDVIPKSIARRGGTTLDALLGPIKDLLNRKRFPEKPFSDSQVEMLLQFLSSMDSDKDPKAVRVGEREGRVASPLVERLSSGFNHGIGRSGHLNAPQPKAAGASEMQVLANRISLDAIRQLGLPNVRDGIVLPLATGMALGLIFASLRRDENIRCVLYPRIDHTSPKRGIALAGLDEIPVATIIEDDSVNVDMSDLENKMSRTKNYAVLATTTFFPPRAMDPVKTIARFCADRDVPLVVNNAYGVQSENVMREVMTSIDAGRVDAIVQSSDKNFLTPVGGSVVVSPKESTITSIAETYAGRASAAPIVQTLASLLLIGLEKYRTMREEQKSNFGLLGEKLDVIASSVGQRVLSVSNPVAYAMTLDGLDAHEIGSRLFNRRVTGPRAIALGEKGSCVDHYPHSYIVMNAAIGVTKNDVEGATAKLYKELSS